MYRKLCSTCWISSRLFDYDRVWSNTLHTVFTKHTGNVAQTPIFNFDLGESFPAYFTCLTKHTRNQQEVHKIAYRSSDGQIIPCDNGFTRKTCPICHHLPCPKCRFYAVFSVCRLAKLQFHFELVSILYWMVNRWCCSELIYIRAVFLQRVIDKGEN